MLGAHADISKNCRYKVRFVTVDESLRIDHLLSRLSPSRRFDSYQDLAVLAPKRGNNFLIANGQGGRRASSTPVSSVRLHSSAILSRATRRLPNTTRLKYGRSRHRDEAARGSPD